MDATHFYTASVNERDALVTARSSGLAYEGIAFYENLTLQAGDTAIFRFFDTAHGTHLFTQNASERASILATRPDLVAEGIAFRHRPDRRPCSNPVLHHAEARDPIKPVAWTEPHGAVVEWILPV